MSKPVLAVLLPNLEFGGAERVVVTLINEFVRKGHSVEIILMSATGELLSDLNPDVSIFNLNAPRIRKVLWPLTHYLRNRKPECLLVCMWPLTAIAIISQKLARTTTRVVVAEHTVWSQSDLFKRKMVRWQVCTSMKYLFPKAHSIVTVSKGIADDLINFAQLKADKMKVIYNPVVSHLMPIITKPLTPIEWSEGVHVKLLAVGRLKPEKDYLTLLKAFALLRHQVDARLLILGDGECRAVLESEVKELGIENFVFMPGFVRDPSPYYSRADLYVLSSVVEGLGNVIIEALAAGTPVVSTDCPSGPREILCDEQFGRLVPVGDVKRLAMAIAESLHTSHDTAALQMRAQDFSIDKSVDQYEKVLFDGLR